METWERVELRGRPAFLIKSEGEVIIGELLAGSLCDPPGQNAAGRPHASLGGPAGFSEGFGLHPELEMERPGLNSSVSRRRRREGNLQQDLDGVTKMVQENSQDIKIAGNFGGKGAVRSGGGSGVTSGGFPGPDHSRPV